MRARHPAARGLLVLACGAVMLLGVTAAAKNASSKSKKKEAVRACVGAFYKAQDLEKAGHLRQARDQWALCARPTCIAFFREECTTRYTQLDADIPTVVPVVTDESGATHVDVEVSVDGELLTSHLDGRALQVDPGMHEFAFKTAAGVVTQRLMIMQGQRNRPVSVALQAPGGPEPPAATAAAADAPEPEPEAADEPAEPPRAAPRPRPKAPSTEAKPDARPAPRKVLAAASDAPAPPTAAPAIAAANNAQAPEGDDDEPRAGASPLTWVLGATGVAALGAGALMIYWGRKDNDMLMQCSPACPPDQVGHIRSMYRAADISVGIGVAALAGSYLVYALTRPTAQKARASSDETLLFDLQPATKAGAVATVSGRF